MPEGTVKWFNLTKGYGFIKPDAGGPDVFLHVSAVQNAGRTKLSPGDRLSYEVVPGRSGKASAEKLTRLPNPDDPF
jgi:CspA family cold shock protein